MRWAGDALTKKWGYSYGDLIDPRRPSGDRSEHEGREAFCMASDIRDAFNIGGGPAIFDGRTTLPPSVVPNTTAVIFDLTTPLVVQIERAERYLKSEQARLVKRGVSVVEQTPKEQPCIEYLRIVDAVEAGEKRAEIARVLYPEKDVANATDVVSKQLKKAKVLRDTGWRRLVLVSE